MLGEGRVDIAKLGEIPIGESGVLLRCCSVEVQGGDNGPPAKEQYFQEDR